jgi:hypothetical protein
MDATYSSAIKLLNLQAYLARLSKELGVEVEQRGHRRWAFRERIEGTRYHRAVARVRIKLVGDANVLTWHPTKCAPTEEEAEAIAAELKDFEFPKSIVAGRPEAEDNVAARPKSEGQLFHYFCNSAREGVIMILERWYKDPTKRIYTTHTLFDENGERVWRRDEEPDGELPFWKPHSFRDKDHKVVSRDRGSVMVHESAKTAAWLDGLLNDPEKQEQREAHPWAEDLRHYEHWGLAGGAERTAEMDYADLRQTEIIGDLVYTPRNSSITTSRHLPTTESRSASCSIGGSTVEWTVSSTIPAAAAAFTTPATAASLTSTWPLATTGPAGRTSQSSTNTSSECTRSGRSDWR